MTSKHITICRAHHAVLYKRFDLRSGDYQAVGNCQGTYGPEDRATGAEYRALGGGEKRGKVSYSSDLKVGHFYSPNVFIFGQNAKTLDPLSHDEIEEFCRRIRWNTFLRRAILPNGYSKGLMTWDNAVYFSPVEFHPDLDTLVRTIKQQIPSAQVDRYEVRIDVYIEEEN